MTLADPKPGGWIDHELLTHTQMNAIRTELLKAIDGAAGGSYTLSSNLTFGGAGELRVDNVLRVLTGADLFVDSGAHFEVNGSGWGFNAAGAFGAQVDFSGNVDFFADVDLRAGATLTVRDLEALNVDALSHTYRVPLIPLGVTFVGSPLEPTWITGTSGKVGQWLNRNASSNSLLYFALPVMAGDSISLVSVGLVGGDSAGHGGVDPTNKVRVRLFEGQSASGAMSSLFSVTDPATGAAYDAGHAIVCDAASTGAVLPYVALNRYYVVEIRSENGGTGADNENLIDFVVATIVRRQLVSTTTFGA